MRMTTDKNMNDFNIVMVVVLVLLSLSTCQTDKQVIELEDRMNTYQKAYDKGGIGYRFCVCWYKAGKPNYISKKSFESFLKESNLQEDSVLLKVVNNLQYGFASLKEGQVLYDFGFDEIDNKLEKTFEYSDSLDSSTEGDIVIFKFSNNHCLTYRSSIQRSVQVFSSKTLLVNGKITIDLGYSLRSMFLRHLSTLEDNKIKNLDLPKNEKRETSKIICSYEDDEWSCQKDYEKLSSHYGYYEDLLVNYLDTSSIIQNLQIDSVEVPLIHW